MSSIIQTQTPQVFTRLFGDSFLNALPSRNPKEDPPSDCFDRCFTKEMAQAAGGAFKGADRFGRQYVVILTQNKSTQDTYLLLFFQRLSPLDDESMEYILHTPFSSLNSLDSRLHTHNCELANAEISAIREIVDGLHPHLKLWKP